MNNHFIDGSILPVKETQIYARIFRLLFQFLDKMKEKLFTLRYLFLWILLIEDVWIRRI